MLAATLHYIFPPKHILGKFYEWTLEGTPAGQIAPNIVNFFFEKELLNNKVTDFL